MSGMKHTLYMAMAVLVLTGCSGGSEEAAETAALPEVAPADLVLRGGKVATVDPDLGNVEAIAVNGYQITAVGSDEEISTYIGPETEVIELDGRFAMPGFIEGHGHYMGLGRSKQILDLRNVENWNEIVTMVSGAVDKAQPGEWIFGRGWHQDKWDSVPEDAVDGVPRNDSLNAVSPENPVALGHASGHAAFYNHAALEAAGITDDTPDPAGGTIVRTPDGRATGLMRETAQRLLSEAIGIYQGRLTPEEMEQIDRERVMLAADEALRHGITSFQDAGTTLEGIEFFKQLEEEGNLPIRLYVMVRRASNDVMDEVLPQYLMLPEGNDFLTVRSIKRQIDGALGAHGAWLLEPYEDLSETEGLVLETIEDIERTAEIAVKHGFQVNTHAIGDRGVREVLDLYERAWETMGVEGNDLRWRIEHSQHIDPIDVPRFGALGVVASVQAIHGTSDGPWIPTRLGDERAKATSQPWRHLFETGALVTNGTDVPVEPIDAIASYYASVSRMMVNGERFYPEHAMTREEALQTYTINNAIAAFEDDIKGTLTPGKYADITVLSQDLLTVEEDQIPNTTVDITIVGGEVKYTRGM
ncbi:MAG: amidohydrolase [Gammaproteobacteria bacterium]|nr:amidohydrolase [Gammaproteobacteria bacterium]